jgi:hypothetical protein
MEKRTGGFGGGLGSDLGFIKTGHGTADSFSQNYGAGQKRSIDQRSEGGASNNSKNSSVNFALKDAIKGRFGGIRKKKSPMGTSQDSDEGKFGAPTLKML